MNDLQHFRFYHSFPPFFRTLNRSSFQKKDLFAVRIAPESGKRSVKVPLQEGTVNTVRQMPAAFSAAEGERRPDYSEKMRDASNPVPLQSAFQSSQADS